MTTTQKVYGSLGLMCFSWESQSLRQHSD